MRPNRVIHRFLEAAYNMGGIPSSPSKPTPAPSSFKKPTTPAPSSSFKKPTWKDKDPKIKTKTTDPKIKNIERQMEIKDKAIEDQRKQKENLQKKKERLQGQQRRATSGIPSGLNFLLEEDFLQKLLEEKKKGKLAAISGYKKILLALAAAFSAANAENKDIKKMNQIKTVKELKTNIVETVKSDSEKIKELKREIEQIKREMENRGIFKLLPSSKPNPAKIARTFLSAIEPLSEDSIQKINDISEALLDVGLKKNDFVINIEAKPPEIEIDQRVEIEGDDIGKLEDIPGIDNMKVEGNKLILTLKV